MSEAPEAIPVNPDPENFARVLMATPRYLETGPRRQTLLQWFYSREMRAAKGAQAYLLQVASGRHGTQTECLAAAGLSPAAKTLYEWRDRYPAFEEVEDILWTEPVTAAQFICLTALPQVATYWKEVLSGKHSGNKGEAARFIAHISDPSLRQRSSPTMGPPQAPANQGKYLKKSLSALLELEDDEE